MKSIEASFAGSSTRVGEHQLRDLPEFAFVGRSNVGKSSLINCLCGNSKLAMTSATPGKTRVVNHFLVNDSWYLVDLPGYGFAKVGKKGQEAIRDILRDYIHLSPRLVQLFVLVDSRHDIGALDRDFIAELGENSIPFSIIFTKCDKSGPVALSRQLDRDREILLQDWETLPKMFCSSSVTASGREEILDYIRQTIQTLQ